jgi:DNA-binding transcriptional MerR regulator
MKPEPFHQFDQLAVAEARKLFGLTGRALRYYEELGLVAAHRDCRNARWYDPVARRRLEWIARLRRSVPLHEIAEVLGAEEQQPGYGRALALRHLHRRRVALVDELARLDALIGDVRADGYERTAPQRATPLGAPAT